MQTPPNDTQDDISADLLASAGLNLNVPIEKIPKQGLSLSVKLTESERKTLQAMLDLVDIQNFEVDVEIKKAGAQSYRLKGRVSADIVQNCIVTLERLNSSLQEDIDTRFLPAFPKHAKPNESQEITETIDINPLEQSDTEGIVDNVLNVGKVIYETFATAIEPYPRKNDVSFEWDDPLNQDDDIKKNSNNPFAVIKEWQKD